MKPLERWWSGFPMVRIWVVLSIGILCYDGKHDRLAILILILSFCLSILFALARLLPSGKLKAVSSIPVLILVACIGYVLMMTHDIRNDPNWLGEMNFSGGSLLAEIAAEPSRNQKSSRCLAKLRACRRNGTWVPASGKLWIQLPPGKFIRGQFILSSISPQRITGRAAQENEFYKYLLGKQVFFLLNLSEGQFRMIQHPAGLRFSSIGQEYLRTVLESHITQEASRSMAAAILFGERTALPKYLTQAYTQTGVIHVIAISGMHLAIIYSLISFLLRPLKNNRLKWIYCLSCIGLLWIYTWICGSTPSVQRSAWMFSFLLVGETLERNNRAGNSLAASAILMLCVDPFLLWDIGFQLSYAAVASLLIYQKAIFQMLNPENLLLLHGWNLVSTTLAAQILTTPLVIFHFGQFPTIFLLSNILAVPLSGLILLLLCGAALVHPIGLGALPANLAAYLIQFMNTRIQALSQLSFASISNLDLNIRDLINIYLLLLALTLWIRSKKR